MSITNSRASLTWLAIAVIVLAVTACQANIPDPTPPASGEPEIINESPDPNLPAIQEGLGADRRPLPVVNPAFKTMKLDESAAARADEPGAVQVATALEGLPEVSAAPKPSEENVLVPTYSWINVVSLETTLNGSPVPAGSVITAYDPQGVLIGRYVVHAEGRFGPMALYMDDPGTQLDEGASAGNAITFSINGLPADPTGPGSAVWSYNGDLIVLNLSAGTQ